MKPLYLLPLVTLLFAPLVHADQCDDATTQAQMNQCIDQRHKAADTELNAVYQQITQRLKSNPDAKKLLVSAQRAWLGFRDAECTFAASRTLGGSAYPMVVADCVTTQNIARTQALKVYLACDEGDLGCPVPAQ